MLDESPASDPALPGLPRGTTSQDEWTDQAESAPRARRWPTTDELGITIPRLAWMKHRAWILSLGAIAAVSALVLALVTVLGATQWVEQSDPAASSGALLAISCSQRNQCVITSGGLQLVTPDAGRTWQAAGTAFGAFTNDVAATCDNQGCIDANGYGNWLFSYDGGVEFNAGNDGSTAHATPAGSSEFSDNAISCDPDGSLCLELFEHQPFTHPLSSIVETFASCGTNCIGSILVSQQRFRNVIGPTTPDCVSSTTCFATGDQGVWRTTDAGKSWQPRGLHDIGLQGAISCASAADCAVGTLNGDVYFTTDSGASWRRAVVGALQNQPEPCSGDTGFCGANTSDAAVTGIHCWTALHCIICSPGTGSISWQTGRNPPPGLNYSSGAILSTTDGGRTWANQSLPDGVRPWELACGSGTNCWAVGETTSGAPNPPGVILRFAG